MCKLLQAHSCGAGFVVDAAAVGVREEGGARASGLEEPLGLPENMSVFHVPKPYKAQNPEL